MPDVGVNRLNRPLRHIAAETNTRGSTVFFYRSGWIPIISDVYRAYVFDGKVVSAETGDTLSKIFFGKTNAQSNNVAMTQTESVSLANASAETAFNSDTGAYQTWVNLEIRNDGVDFSEYQTEFSLPDGCFVTDYYLYVGTEKKAGLLADKRAALITYESVIRTPRDPGILYYKRDGLLTLRVYPFAAGETRRTGFLVTHSQDETLYIDGSEIALAAENPITAPFYGLLPASYKTGLPPLARTPKYYFVLDGSTGSPYAEHLRKVHDYAEKHGISDYETYTVSHKIIGHDTPTESFSIDGAQTDGFNLPAAIDRIFKTTAEGAYPIIIAVTDNMGKAPDISGVAAAKRFPESGYYYNLGYDLSLSPYAFADGTRRTAVADPIVTGALDYDGAAVADNGKSEFVQAREPEDYTDNAYANALILTAKCRAARDDTAAQTALVRDSFRQRVLTPFTAFTVLETQEQEEALLALQEEFLNSENRAAPAVMMSEPEWWILVLLGLLGLSGLFRHGKMRKRQV
jgi:hypothetical protein